MLIHKIARKILNYIERERSFYTLFLLIRNLLIRKKIKTFSSTVDYIVSLTSFPPRFGKLYLCIESVFCQTVKPRKIILWIAEKDKDSLPKRILNYQKRGLEIHFCEDIRSYKKIIYTLQDFSKKTIITIDDDILYPRKWLETLLDEHKKDPETILCHRARYMTYSYDGAINKYKYWPNLTESVKGYHVFPVGCGGVLYPPGVFSEDVTKKDIFTKLSPTGDDIWLRAMSILKGKMARKVAAYSYYFVDLKYKNTESLEDININGENDIQIDKVFTSYEITEKLKLLERKEIGTS